MVYLSALQHQFVHNSGMNGFLKYGIESIKQTGPNLPDFKIVREMNPLSWGSWQIQIETLLQKLTKRENERQFYITETAALGH